MLRMRHVGRPLAAAIFTFGVASNGRLTRTAPHTAHLYGPPVNRMFVPPQRLRLTGRSVRSSGLACPRGWARDECARRVERDRRLPIFRRGIAERTAFRGRPG